MSWAYSTYSHDPGKSWLTDMKPSAYSSLPEDASAAVVETRVSNANILTSRLNLSCMSNQDMASLE